MISETFSSIATLISLLGDAAVLILTIYTLHITAFSRKLMLVKQSVHYSTFYGDSISLTFMNKSLHAIPVENVFNGRRPPAQRRWQSQGRYTCGDA